MTIAFAECVSDNNNNNNDILYHVEWLDSEEAFPTLGSQTNNNKNSTSPTLQDWQILQKQEVYTDDQDDFLFFHDGKRLTVSEMEDKWEEIHYEKQYVDVAAENLNDFSSVITTNVPPLKPLRHQPNKQQQKKMKKEYTDEELRLLYWDQLDQLILEEEEMNGEAYDVYYARKSQSPRSQRGNMHHLRRRLAFLSLNNHGLQYLNAQYSGNPSLKQFFNTIQSSTEASTENKNNTKENGGDEEEQGKQKAWGAPKINGRILHGLARLSIPSSSHPKHGSKNTKTLSTDADLTLVQ
ncbi:hypothetical protein BJ944DRAFT_262923 [Cunninghamella echinulata]|nr:hypothetical protein BJ944DRAFT_262923 [Cunninghamella echinulata]